MLFRYITILVLVFIYIYIPNPFLPHLEELAAASTSGLVFAKMKRWNWMLSVWVFFCTKNRASDT